MEISKMNDYIVRLVEDKKLTLTALARSVKMKVEDLADALSSKMNIDLYEQIAAALKVSLDTIILCKPQETKRKFFSKFETAVKNGTNAIASLKNQGTNLIEADSYGIHLIEYAINLDAQDVFVYILNNHYFKLDDAYYLKKHPVMSNEDRELYFRCMIYILKNNFSEYFNLIDKFSSLNHGIFKNIDDEYRYLFLYYINKNKLDVVLDGIATSKDKKSKLLKNKEEMLTYLDLAKYAIDFHLSNICAYLGRKMVDFNAFMQIACEQNYDAGVIAYLENSDPSILNQNKNFLSDMQNLYIKYCKEGKLDIVKLLLDKKYYFDLNAGFETAIKEEKNDVSQYLYKTGSKDFDKDRALFIACSSQNTEMVKKFISGASQVGKNNALKQIKDDPKLMILLLKEGACFEQGPDTFNQISILLQYLIKKGG